MELDQAIRLIEDPRLGKLKPATWADLGCGTGLFTHALAHILVPGSTIFAIDQKPELSLENYIDNLNSIKFIQANFIADDLNLNALDGILMANSMHFVQDKMNFLLKIQKYFKAQQRFLFVEYDMDQPNRWVPYPISFSSLKKSFSQLGYETIVKLNSLPSIYNRAEIYSALVLKNHSDL